MDGGFLVVVKSPSLRPSLRQFDQAKSQIGNDNYNSTPGADLEFSISVEPDADFYLGVAGYLGSAGPYKLMITPLVAYDRYEPNDDAFHATAIIPGSRLEASIMDAADVDFYRVAEAAGKKAIVHVENASSTLKPEVAAFNSEKQSINSGYHSTPGANLDLSFDTEPGRSFYIKVSGSQHSSGAYRILVEQ